MTRYNPTSEHYQAETAELFSELAKYGLSGARMKELNRRVALIAKATGAKKSDVYNHFHTKAH